MEFLCRQLTAFLFSFVYMYRHTYTYMYMLRGERHFPLAHVICPTLQADACAVKGFWREVISHNCICVYVSLCVLCVCALFIFLCVAFVFLCCCCFLILFHVCFCFCVCSFRRVWAGKSELISLFSQQRRERNLANASRNTTGLLIL